MLTNSTSSDSALNERGFSLVELIVAIVVLSIVVSGFSLAVSSNERRGVNEAVVNDKVAVARKAQEQLQGNVTAQDYCGTLWSAQETNAANSTTEVAYNPCTWPSTGSWKVQDDSGRTYDVTATMQAVDLPADGSGLAKSLDNTGAGGDADFDTRDRIDVTIAVNLATDSRNGLAPTVAADTYSLHGNVDWDSTRTLGSARIMVCVLDRPDRARANGRCVTADSGQERPSDPANGVTVHLASVDGGTSYSAVSTGGLAIFNGVLPNGTYEVSASGFGARQLYRYAPQVISIDGADPQEGTVYLTRSGSNVEVCVRIANPDLYGFGWKITQTSLNWGAVGTELRRAALFSGLSNAWTCKANAIVDPMGYSNTNLYRGVYALEVALVNDPQGSLSIASHPTACPTGNLALWTATPTTALPQVLPGSQRYKFDFADRDDNTARMCIELNSTPIPAVDCPAGSPAPCIKVDTTCIPATCAPSRACANCDIVPLLAPSSYPYNAGTLFHNGPNESNVACRNRRDAGVWNRGSLYYGGAAQRNRSIWSGYQFLGVNDTYQAKHPDGRWNECPEITFTMTRSQTATCGRFSVLSPCPARAGRPFQLGQCIEASVNGRVVRGPLYDTQTYGSGLQIGLVIGAWDRIIDTPAVDINWHGYSIPRAMGNPMVWPRANFRIVTGDPICQASNVPPEPEDEIITDEVPATIIEVWKEPGIDDVGDPIWPVPQVETRLPVNSTKSL